LQKQFGMPPDLHIPIAARNKEAITAYIGKVDEIFQNSSNAFLVTPYEIPPQNNKLPIWEVDGVELLHLPKQVWVKVDYTRYRKAYCKAFPEHDFGKQVIDHVMNRRVARLKGFEYLRVIPVSRAVNSSSGKITEKYGFEYHNTERVKKIYSEKQAFIQYCEMADLVKMLNIKTGGKFQEGINEVLYYFFEKKGA